MTKPKSWTERRAWLYLARRWDAARPRRWFPRDDAYAVSVYAKSALGLCKSIGHLYRRGRIRACTSEDMQIRLLDNAPRNYKLGYYWPHTLAGARKRAALCRRLAKEAGNES